MLASVLAWYGIVAAVDPADAPPAHGDTDSRSSRVQVDADGPGAAEEAPTGQAAAPARSRNPTDSTYNAHGRKHPPLLGEPFVTAETPGLFCPSSSRTLPALVADGGRLGQYELRAASLVGRSHKASGDTREDDYAAAISRSGTVVLAVADGVGDRSVVHAAVGARAAVLEACRLVVERIDSEDISPPSALVEDIAAAALRQARGVVGADKASATLATTLCVVALAPDGTYRGFSVGDSGAAVLDGDTWRMVTKDAALLSNDTGPTLHAEGRSQQNFEGRLPRGAALLLATDGLLIPLEATEVNHGLACRWRVPPARLLDFVSDASFERRGEFDDRTVVCAWYRPGQ